MKPTLRIAVAAAVATLAILACAASASAQGYDMSLTLPTYGKSGCMVCHGDPNLVRIKGGRLVSFYISPEALKGTAHANVLCTACHTDFAYTLPHNAGANWRAVAKSACQNCHKPEAEEFSRSIHGPGQSVSPTSSAAGYARPLCGDCHPGHYIPLASKDPAAAAQIHASSKQMCGNCHPAFWLDYDDYYHGAAYKQGAADAPACWQCHGTHDIQPTKDRRSQVNPNNLVTTCGKCHKGASEGYTAYAVVIHRKSDALSSNPLYAVIQQTGKAIAGAFGGVFGSIRTVFTPQSAKAQTR